MLKKILPAIVIIMQLGFSVTAIPESMQLFQPDGTSFNAYLRGDEWQNWYETAEGYTIALNASQIWVYVAGVKAGEFILSETPANLETTLSVEKHLQPQAIPHDLPTNIPDISSQERTEFLVPMLLIEYPDLNHTYPVENFINLMNQEGYESSHGATGSFRDYYLENSYYAFDPNTTLYGWFMADLPHDVYGSSAPNGWDLVRQMIRAAVDDAEAQGVDWTQYDNDGDGNVDALNVIHAGFGAEEGDGSNVWSHRWSLGSYAVTYDGVTINDYTINPEKQGMNNSPGIVNIGVVCHEFGHALGLPDLYDTDYSSSGIGTWGLMAGGSWGGNGSSAWYPAHFSAWSKVTLGWVDPIIITEGSISLEIPNVEENPVIYKMNGIGPNYEYFLFENRQKIHFDQTLTNSGMLIWHIDNSMGGNQNDWHYKVDLEQADGNFDLNFGRGSDMSDPYPGGYGVTEFTDYTTPDSRFYSGETSGISVLNISEENLLITANFRNLPTIYVSDFSLEEIDGDGDGVANPGEIGAVTPVFYNPSEDTIENLSAQITSQDVDITLLTETIVIADLSGQSNGSGETVLFDIAPGASLGEHRLQFSITGEMANGDPFDQTTTLAFEVTIDQAGFPLETGIKVVASPLVFDLDQDGQNEIIFGDYAGYLHVTEPDGSPFGGQWPFDTGNQIWGSPAVADLDQDGIAEIIVTSKSRHLYVLAPDGTVETDYNAGEYITASPAIGNLDDDPQLEIIFGGFTGSGDLFAVHADGSDVNGFPVSVNEKIYAGAGLADLNDNGKMDIVFGTDSGNLYLVLDDGSVAPGFPVNIGNKIRSAPLLADLDQDDLPEIIFGCDDGFLHAIDSNGEEVFTFDAGASIRTSPAIDDANGVIKLFFGTTDGQVFGVDALGQSLF
ncbi:MAG: M6 family metalloprotease domain-containing protein, partial [FCB group bacterium]|nr:M6 family metalloprotease domain-containing protein [FCB group bacterium]